MTPADTAALRAKACDVIASLGSVLDTLKIVDDVIANPIDEFSSSVILAQHLDEAAATMETACEFAHELALAIDKQQEGARVRAVALEGGAS